MKKDVKKALTRTEVLTIIDRLRTTYGDVMVKPLVLLRRNSKKVMYTTSLEVSFLLGLCCRYPRNMENPEGIQRALNTSKVMQIRNAMEEKEKPQYPNNISIAMRSPEEFNEHVKRKVLEIQSGEALPIPGVRSGDLNLLKIHLNQLRDYYEFDCPVDEEDNFIEPLEDFISVLCDGHHRLQGAFEAGQMDYEFATTIMMNAYRKDLAVAFDLINAHQDKPSPTHVLMINVMADLLTGEQSLAYNIADQLNSGNGDSKDGPEMVLQNHINFYDGPRDKSLPPAYLKAIKMQKLLEKWLQDEKDCSNATTGNDPQACAKVINDYLLAWKQVYPDAFGDRKYVLTKAMGIQLMLGAYRNLYGYLQRRLNIVRYGECATTEQFVRALKDCLFVEEDGDLRPIRLNEMNPEMEYDIPLDWSGENFRALSSGAGIGQLNKLINNYILNVKINRQLR